MANLSLHLEKNRWAISFLPPVDTLRSASCANVESPTSDPDPDACIPGWYCAYFGTYTVDIKNGVWVTHVLGANIPGFLKTDQPRHFTIVGDTLVVSETYLNGGTRIKAERIFVRETV